MIGFLIIFALLTPLFFFIKAPSMNSGAYIGRLFIAILIFWLAVGTAAYLERESEEMNKLTGIAYGDAYDLLCGTMKKGWLFGLIYLLPWVLLQAAVRGVVNLTREKRQKREQTLAGDGLKSAHEE